MRTVYIDENFICHPDYTEGRTAVETDALDNVCASALRFYIYVPKDSVFVKPNGDTIQGEFIQCTDSKSADMEQLRAENEAYRLLIDELYAEVTS